MVKVASLNGGRDGRLVVVSHDLARAAPVPEVAPTLQAALDDWQRHAPALERASADLNANASAAAFDFDPRHCAAPLPRAYQWADGSAYVNHMELVRKARGAEMPESFWTDPLMYQGGSDTFLGPCEDIAAADEDFGIDFESEIAIVTDDVPMGIGAAEARQHIALVMLANDVSLRNLIPAELAKGFGFLHGKPPTAFSPLALTPDELGTAWRGAKIHLPLRTLLNGELFGAPHAGDDMVFDFGHLIAHAAKTRPLGAGTVIGSGTVSNRDASRGSSCIAERRMIETIEGGQPVTPFLKYGDRVRIEMLDAGGATVFGAIEQTVTPPPAG